VTVNTYNYSANFGGSCIGANAIIEARLKYFNVEVDKPPVMVNLGACGMGWVWDCPLLILLLLALLMDYDRASS
jgi:hypothetical protein